MGGFPGDFSVGVLHTSPSTDLQIANLITHCFAPTLLILNSNLSPNNFIFSLLTMVCNCLVWPIWITWKKKPRLTWTVTIDCYNFDFPRFCPRCQDDRRKLRCFLVSSPPAALPVVALFPQSLPGRGSWTIQRWPNWNRPSWSRSPTSHSSPTGPISGKSMLEWTEHSKHRQPQNTL